MVFLLYCSYHTIFFIVYLKSSIYSMSSLIHSRLIPMPCPSSPMNVTDKLNRSSGLVMFITYQFSIVTDGRWLTDQEEQTFALIRHIGLHFKTISFNMGNTNLVTATLEYLKPVYLQLNHVMWFILFIVPVQGQNIRCKP